MLLATCIGAIAASSPLDDAPPELPQSIDGLQGWISTTKGRFLFGDGSSTPGHGKTVQQARSVHDQTALFSQATAGLRPTWDAATFDVPCIRSDGTQYLVRETSLPAPGLVIVGCAFNSGSVGFHALTGARSTETPGGSEAREDAWHLNKAHPINTMRALAATSSGQMFTDTPQILGEKLLVMLEIVGDALQLWQVGATGEQTIVGSRIAADGEQALLANYFDDAIAAIMQGAIFEFVQYAPAPSRAERRMLVEYFQALIWPAVSPPLAATIDAGQIEPGQSTLVDVVTPSSGMSLMLASIDEQPEAGSLAVSGNNIQISVPSGAPLGTYGGRYCLRSDAAGARVVDFGRVDFEVVEASAAIELPHAGLFYGSSLAATGHGDTKLRSSTTIGVSTFFYAPRTGTVTKWRMNKRVDNVNGYSAGDGGTYTVEIRPAIESTKLPDTAASPICQRTGWSPGISAGSAAFPTVDFTTTGQLTFGEPYCIIFRNSHSNPGSNYFSMNNFVQYNFSAQGISMPSPAGGWSPVVIGGKTWFPFPVTADNGTFRHRIGPPILDLGWSDGIWTGSGSVSGFGGTDQTISGANQRRERFRVTRANRTINGVWLKIVRLNNTGGNITIWLESGPSSDTSGNGTAIEQAVFPSSHVPNVGSREDWNEVQHSPPFDKLPWIFFPFGSNHTLEAGTIYNLRVFGSGGGTFWISPSQRGEHSNAQWSPVASNWDQHEANRGLAWDGSFEDSRGVMTSSNSGSSWGYLGGNNRQQVPILFQCVAV